MCRIERMLDLAAEEAETSQSNFRLGAVLAHKRYIVGRGINASKTHTKIAAEKKSKIYTLMHAEIAAILDTEPAHLIHADLYVARLKKDGERAMARPCEMCMEVIKKHGVNRVFYTIGDNEWGAIKV